MSAKAFVPILILGIGLPAFIFYSVFFGGPSPEMRTTANFKNYQESISDLNNQRYEVLGVVDEGGSIRINVWFREPAADPVETRIQTLNTLYDVQSIVGPEVSVIVWIYSSPAVERSMLRSLAFYQAQTGRTVYRHPDDLR